ncbi:5-hydroxytryptamine receptor 1A-alpha-like [Lytechinus pictus]|uniref:5-hydroxytryptamine receptor 1A-alpha-like n=1 Tax=Lytechinus pictus TaxID=7653 RepID=UPI0030B9E104
MVMVTVFDHGSFLLRNKIMCLVSGNVLFVFGNFATVMVISVDRYLSVVWSDRFPPSKPRTIAFIAITWVIAIGSSFPSLFGRLAKIRYKQMSHGCGPDWEGNCFYYIILNIAMFAFIVPAMVLCYTGVFLKVWRQKQVLRSKAFSKPSVVSTPMLVPPVQDDDNGDDYSKDIQTDDDDNPDEGTSSIILTPANSLDCTRSLNIKDSLTNHVKRQSKEGEGIHRGTLTTVIKNKNHRSMQRKLNIEKRVALTGTLLVLTTLGCWAPYCVVNSCVLSLRIPHWVVVAAVWLGSCNCLLDPLIYTFMQRRIGSHYRCFRSH